MLDVMVQRNVVLVYLRAMYVSSSVRIALAMRHAGGRLRMRIRSHLPRPLEITNLIGSRRPEHQYFLGSYFYAMFFILWEVSYQC